MSQLQKKTLLLWVSCFFAGYTFLFAQDKSPVKFGKITATDFNLPLQKFDSGAEAVVIADIGNSIFVGNNRSSFSLEFHRFKRVKIIGKGAFDEAQVTISLYVDGSKVEKLENLKAITYNLENGKIVESRLDDKSVFTEIVDKHHINKKFTFPSVKEGSIVEYSYTQSSDFIFNLQPWNFQGEYPCLWSEYQVDIPDFYRYVFIGQGYVPFDINTSSTSHSNFRVTFDGGAERSETENFDAEVVNHRWVLKNAPALKTESFTTTLRNHICKIEFQLSQIHYPNSVVKNVMATWTSLSEELMKDDLFGADVSRNNGWLNDEMRAVTLGAATPRQKAEKIFTYLRDHFTCTGHEALYVDNPIKTVFKNRNGNVAAINLLLTAMLKHENIEADPVLLSTRQNGVANTMYPLLDRYNYVICRARIDSSIILLDASQPWLGFNRIPSYCYNGQGRIINETASQPIDLNADDITESKSTMVFIFNDDKGGLSGTYQSTPGYFESSTVREKLHDKGEKDFFTSVQSEYTGGVKIANTEIDSAKLPDYPVKVAYDLSIPHDSTEDIIYFSPILAPAAYKENPFKAATRNYPVEIPYAIDETYVLNMEVPKGYTVEESPKSTKVLFNTDEGYFEYLVQKDESNIQMRSRVKLLRANFKPEDYSVLRDFFAYVVKKQSEQFVFKKKK